MASLQVVAGEHSSPLQAGGNDQRLLILRLAALLAQFGPDRADAALERLRYPNAVRQTVKALLEALDVGDDLPRLVFAKLGRERAELFVSLVHALGYRDAGLCAKELAEIERRKMPFSPSELAIGGKDVCAALGIAPSPKVGEILRGLWLKCVTDPGLNTRKRLLDELAKGDYL